MSASAGGGSPPGDKGKGPASKSSTPTTTPKKKTPGSTPGSKTPGSGSRASGTGSQTSTPTKKGLGSNPATPTKTGTSSSAKSTPSKKGPKYPDGDGTTKETAKWSETFKRDPTQPSVVVERHMPPPPKFIRETLPNSQQYVGLANFYDGNSLQQLSALPGSSGYNPSPNTAFYGQHEEIRNTEQELEGAGEELPEEDVMGEDEDEESDD